MATELTEYGKLLESFRQREEGARLSNLTRKDQITSIYDDIIKRYQPGGGFGAGYEQQLQRQKVHDVGASQQRDISRGLHGIRPYEQEWEATTGATGRLKLEDIRMERLSGAQTGMAGFLERIDEPYPDYNSLLAASQAQGAGGGGGYSEPRQPEDITGKLASARASNWAFQGLGGGGGGGGTAPGQSATQQALAERNKAALAYRDQLSSGGDPLAGAGSYTTQGSTQPTAGVGKTQQAPFSLKNSTWGSYQAYAAKTGGKVGSKKEYEAAKRYAN